MKTLKADGLKMISKSSRFVVWDELNMILYEGGEEIKIVIMAAKIPFKYIFRLNVTWSLMVLNSGS